MSPDARPEKAHDTQPKPVKTPEREHEGPIWKHPYMVYILMTAVLFLLLVVAAWLAVENDWIPRR